MWFFSKDPCQRNLTLWKNIFVQLRRQIYFIFFFCQHLGICSTLNNLEKEAKLEYYNKTIEELKILSKLDKSYIPPTIHPCWLQSVSYQLQPLVSFSFSKKMEHKEPLASFLNKWFWCRAKAQYREPTYTTY